MKKINYIFIILLILFVDISVNAKIKYDKLLCNDDKTYVVGFNDNLYVYKGNDYNTYYIIKNNKCSKATTDEIIKFNNRKVHYNEYYYNLEGEDIINSYELSSSFVIGYLINTDKYNEDTTYYRYDKNYNKYYEIFEDEFDSELVNTYYINGYFKNISKVENNSEKTYYTYNKEINLFSIYTGEINNDNVLDIYEKINLSDITISKKTYTISNEFIDKIYEDDDSYVKGIIIFDKLYYYTYKTDEESNLISTKYYDEKFNLINELNNKKITEVDGYLIASNLDGTLFEIYNKNFKLLDSISFKSKYTLSSAVKTNNKIYMNIFMEVDMNVYSIGFDIPKSNIIVYIVIIVPIIIIAALVVYIIKKRKI